MDTSDRVRQQFSDAGFDKEKEEIWIWGPALYVLFPFRRRNSELVFIRHNFTGGVWRYHQWVRSCGWRTFENQKMRIYNNENKNKAPRVWVSLYDRDAKILHTYSCNVALTDKRTRKARQNKYEIKKFGVLTTGPDLFAAKKATWFFDKSPQSVSPTRVTFVDYFCSKRCFVTF